MPIICCQPSGHMLYSHDITQLLAAENETFLPYFEQSSSRQKCLLASRTSKTKSPNRDSGRLCKQASVNFDHCCTPSNSVLLVFKLDTKICLLSTLITRLHRLLFTYYISPHFLHIERLHLRLRLSIFMVLFTLSGEKQFKKIFVETSHHFVEPLVVSVSDFGWLLSMGFKARVDAPSPALNVACT